MIIKASQRSGARNLANHLASTKDNDHVTIHEVRGLIGQSLHAAFLEMDASSHATRCEKPLFSASFNPPIGADVTHDQFEKAFDQLERKLGLDNQPRVVVFHEKEGRRHAHVVWSRIDIDRSKAIHMAHFKKKCTDISRQLYLEYGWELPKGLEKQQDRDPFNLSVSEWQSLKRKSIDPRDIKALCQDAWAHSDGVNGFKYALEEKGLFLARGDKRGFVVVDHTENVYSLSRVGGIKTKELKQRLGLPDPLPSVSETSTRIRTIYNRQALERIKSLKTKHDHDMSRLNDQKAQLVHIQRAERKELQDQQRVKRRITEKSAKERYRKGVRGLFDRVSGRNRRIRLINEKEGRLLLKRQTESREKMIFRHNMERANLQKPIAELRAKQHLERAQLAKAIHLSRMRDEARSQIIAKNNAERKDSKISRDFERSSSRIDSAKNDRRAGRETGHVRKRLRSRKPI